MKRIFILSTSYLALLASLPQVKASSYPEEDQIINKFSTSSNNISPVVDIDAVKTSGSVEEHLDTQHLINKYEDLKQPVDNVSDVVDVSSESEADLPVVAPVALDEQEDDFFKPAKEQFKWVVSDLVDTDTHKYALFDFNEDGSVNISDVSALFSASGHAHIRHILDVNGDGTINADDVRAGVQKLWSKVHKIFDINEDGKIEFKEIMQGTQHLLGHIGEVFEKLIVLVDRFTQNEYFQKIPATIRTPLTDFTNLLRTVSTDAQQGLDVADNYIGNIDEKLKLLKERIKELSQEGLNFDEIVSLRKEMFELLETVKVLDVEMSRGADDNIDHTRLVTNIQRKMARLDMSEFPTATTETSNT